MFHGRCDEFKAQEDCIKGRSNFVGDVTYESLPFSHRLRHVTHFKSSNTTGDGHYRDGIEHLNIGVPTDAFARGLKKISSPVIDSSSSIHNAADDRRQELNEYDHLARSKWLSNRVRLP